MKKNLRMYKKRNKIFIYFIFIFLINRIQVQLDGNEYAVDQHGAQIPVDVFQSTTVRELRAIVRENFFFKYIYVSQSFYFLSLNWHIIILQRINIFSLMVV